MHLRLASDLADTFRPSYLITRAFVGGLAVRAVLAATARRPVPDGGYVAVYTGVQGYIQGYTGVHPTRDPVLAAFLLFSALSVCNLTHRITRGHLT